MTNRKNNKQQPPGKKNLNDGKEQQPMAEKHSTDGPKQQPVEMHSANDEHLKKRVVKLEREMGQVQRQVNKCGIVLDKLERESSYQVGVVAYHNCL
jgi:hypothetical protein